MILVSILGTEAADFGATPKVLAEKLPTLSFRGTLFAEEFLYLLEFNPREIPHFVRNDSERISSATCYGASRGTPTASLEPWIALILNLFAVSSTALLT